MMGKTSHDLWPTNKYKITRGTATVVQEAQLVGLTLCPPDPHSLLHLTGLSYLFWYQAHQPAGKQWINFQPQILGSPYCFWLIFTHPSSHSIIFVSQAFSTHISRLNWSSFFFSLIIAFLAAAHLSSPTPPSDSVLSLNKSSLCLFIKVLIAFSRHNHAELFYHGEWKHLYSSWIFLLFLRMICLICFTEAWNISNNLSLSLFFYN